MWRKNTSGRRTGGILVGSPDSFLSRSGKLATLAFVPQTVKHLIEADRSWQSLYLSSNRNGPGSTRPIAMLPVGCLASLSRSGTIVLGGEPEVNGGSRG